MAAFLGPPACLVHPMPLTLYSSSDTSWLIPAGFITGGILGALLWRLCLPAITKRYTLEQQMRLGLRGFILAFFAVSPVSLVLMTTRIGTFAGIFLFACAEVFFMVVVQSARFQSKK